MTMAWSRPSGAVAGGGPPVGNSRPTTQTVQQSPQSFRASEFDGEWPKRNLNESVADVNCAGSKRWGYRLIRRKAILTRR